MENIIDLFKSYLANEGVAPVSVINYIIDLRNFFEWFILRLKTAQIKFNEDKAPDLASLITKEAVIDYKNFLLNNSTPIKTINRRLSTLRKFGTFSVSQFWLKNNPAKEISNAGTRPITYPTTQELLLQEFKTDLEIEHVNPLTINNYLADTKQFLRFLGV